MYEQATKCEKKVKGTSYQDNSGCDLIHNIIPKLSTSLKGGSSAAKVFAWIFGIAVVAMGWYIYRLHKILSLVPTKVDTSGLIGVAA